MCMMESSSHERKESLVCDPCRVKKIRCGRERPCCSNCQRLGQPCSWTGHGKKPSQTTTLSQSLELLGARFDRLESVILEIKQSLEKLHEEKRSASFATAPPPQHTSRIASDEVKKNGQMVDPITLHSLARDVQRLILKRCESDEQLKRVAATSVNEKLEALLECPAFVMDEAGEEIPPQMPPVDLVRSMIPTYFDQISPGMPLWTQDGFLKMMDRAASSDETTDWATIACANNLVLITLVAKSRRQKSKTRSNPLDSVSGVERSPMELVFLNTFLQNAKRALQRIELLQSPSLLNIQALLSLCLVAQQHWSIEILSRLFYQAAYLAKCISLDRFCTYNRNNSSHEDFQEPINALRCLCVIGSSIPWVSGCQSFFFSKEAYDVAITVPESLGVPEAEKTLEMHRKAQISLTKLEEQAFTALYALQMHGQICTKLQQDSTAFHKELNHWSSQYISARSLDPISGSLQDESSLTIAPNADVELQIRYHTMRLLLAWPLQGYRQDDDSVLLDSRACLKLVIGVRDADAGLKDQERLARILVSYPPLAFCALLSHVIHKGDRSSTGALTYDDDDLQLLQSYTDVVQEIFSLAEDRTYARQLIIFKRSLVEFAVDQKHSLHLQATPPQSLALAGQANSNDIVTYDMFVAPDSSIDLSQMDFDSTPEMLSFNPTPEFLNSNNKNLNFGASYDLFSGLF